LIEKDLQPSDHFSLGNWLGTCNSGFGRRRIHRLRRWWCNWASRKTEIRFRGWHRLGSWHFRLGRIRDKRRRSRLLRMKACRNPKNPDDNKKLLINHTQ
jgi:hypothetical protein